MTQATDDRVIYWGDSTNREKKSRRGSIFELKQMEVRECVE